MFSLPKHVAALKTPSPHPRRRLRPPPPRRPPSPRPRQRLWPPTPPRLPSHPSAPAPSCHSTAHLHHPMTPRHPTPRRLRQLACAGPRSPIASLAGGRVLAPLAPPHDHTPPHAKTPPATCLRWPTQPTCVASWWPSVGPTAPSCHPSAHLHHPTPPHTKPPLATHLHHPIC
jgi:hypothetical protein